MTAPSAPAGSLSGFALRVVVAITLVALATLTWRLHDVLLLVFAAVLVSVILHAAADGVCRVAPIGKGFAIAIAALLIAGLLGAVALLFGQEMGSQLSGLGDLLPAAWQQFVEWVGEGRVQSLLDTVSPDGSTVTSIAQTAFGTISAAFTGLMLAVLGGIYLAAGPRG